MGNGVVRVGPEVLGLVFKLNVRIDQVQLLWHVEYHVPLDYTTAALFTFMHAHVHVARAFRLLAYTLPLKLGCFGLRVDADQRVATSAKPLLRTARSFPKQLRKYSR